jgi:hypothetical protein
MADSIEAAKKSNIDKSQNAERPKMIEWKGTVTELADKALQDYNKKKFKNLTKACREYSKKYLIDAQEINQTSLYTIASDIRRGERERKNKQK